MRSSPRKQKNVLFIVDLYPPSMPPPYNTPFTIPTTPKKRAPHSLLFVPFLVSARRTEIQRGYKSHKKDITLLFSGTVRSHNMNCRRRTQCMNQQGRSPSSVTAPNYSEAFPAQRRFQLARWARDTKQSAEPAFCADSCFLLLTSHRTRYQLSGAADRPAIDAALLVDD